MGMGQRRWLLMPPLTLVVMVVALAATSVQGGQLSVLVKNGKVAGRDIFSDSDPIARIRVDGLTGWKKTREVQDDNTPEWNDRLNFGSDIPSKFTLGLHVREPDTWFEGSGYDDLGSSSSTFDFNGCGSRVFNHRFTGLRKNGWVDVTVEYDPTNLCLYGNNGNCGSGDSTGCTCIADNQVDCFCLPGYELGSGGRCTPVNNCHKGNYGGCVRPNERCVFAGPGVNDCVCGDGFRQRFPGQAMPCDPINPCEDDPERCGANSMCMHDGPGDFHCDCNQSHESPSGDGSNCRPINRCEVDNGGCNNATELCRYTGPNTTACDCKPDHQAQDGTSCDAVNPCEEDTDICGSNSQCIYTGPGQYQCECLPGYHAPNTPNNTDCVAINRCQTLNGTDSGICGDFSTCTFTGPLTYTCMCDENYESSTGASCTPINPCDTNNGGCLSATCVYTAPNARECQCLPGHSKTSPLSVQCLPINPCDTNNGGCGSPSTTRCTQTGPELRNCSCLTGYTSRTGENCYEINPCIVDNGGCGPENSTRCVHFGPDDATCECLPGFEGNPPIADCEPVDPCTLEGVCGVNSECTRVGLFGFNCTCRPGYNSTTGANCTAVVASTTTTTDPASSGSSSSTSLSGATLGGIIAGACGAVIIGVVLVLLVRWGPSRRRVLHGGGGGGSGKGVTRTSVLNPVFRPSACNGEQSTAEYAHLEKARTSTNTRRPQVQQPSSYSHLSRDRPQHTLEATPGAALAQYVDANLGGMSENPGVYAVPSSPYHTPASAPAADSAEQYDLPRSTPASAAAQGSTESYDMPRKEPRGQRTASVSSSGARGVAGQYPSTRGQRRLQANSGYTQHMPATYA